MPRRRPSQSIDRPDKLPGIVPQFLTDYRNYLSNVHGKSSKTAFEYSYHILIFLRYLAVTDNRDSNDLSWVTPERLNAVTYTDILAFLEHEAVRGCGPSSRSNKITALRSLYSYLRDLQLVSSNPMEKVVSPKLGTTIPKYLTEREANRLLDTILQSGKENRERDYCMIVILLNCGLRRSELRSLNISDVDGDRNVLRITGKGNKMREIPLNDRALGAINDYILIRKADKKCPKSEPALFVSNQGKRVSPETIEKMVKRRLLEAGIDPSRASVHSLRHTFATLTYNATGGDIRSVQSLLGHNSLATTQIYTHINNQQLSNAVNQNPLNLSDADSD